MRYDVGYIKGHKKNNNKLFALFLYRDRSDKYTHMVSIDRRGGEPVCAQPERCLINISEFKTERWSRQAGKLHTGPTDWK